jgi:hypothetical protein
MIAWQRGEDIDTAVLIVGELVTNAVRYGTAPPILIVDEVEGSLRCSVHDDSADHPVLLPPYRYVESGRGMWLIAGLSCRWGIEDGGTYPDGKVVWCVLRHEPDHGRLRACERTPTTTPARRLSDLRRMVLQPRVSAGQPVF